MNKFVFAITFTCLASSLLPACKKDMPPVVAARWAAIEDLARTAGPICDRVLALAECPLKSDHVGPDQVPDTEEGATVRLPASPLIGATEVRQVEVLCETKGQKEFGHWCYLQRHFDAKGPQIDAGWTCGGDKPYPGWEHTKDGLAFAWGRKNCQEELYHAWMRRKSPAGHTVQAGVYFYVDGHPPAVAPTPGPQ
jgi:hypothetical protein